MATYTTNLNLKKPGQQDKIRIADINNNMDDIDAAFGAVGTESMAAQLGAIQDSIAIVATGNAHAAISAGQFVYVKSHETLDTGLYVATSNISENGTLSSSNLTADTAGGLNALNSKVTNLEGFTAVTFTPESGITNALFIRRNNRVVVINGYLQSTNAFGSNQLLGTIASGHRPSSTVRFLIEVASAAYEPGEVAYGSIGTDGKLSITAKSGNTFKNCYFSVSYIV